MEERAAAARAKDDEHRRAQEAKRVVNLKAQDEDTAYFQEHRLWWRFRKKLWSDEFRDTPGRFYCSRCLAIHRRKARPQLVEASTEPAEITLPMPEEGEWKRAIQKFRC